MSETTDTRLRLFVERIERLKEEAKGIRDDIRDVFAEAKAVGYCPTTLRKLIARREQSPDDRAEADAMLQTYEAALGMENSAPFTMAELHPDAMQLATEMLAEQAAAIDDPEQAAVLAEHVLAILDIRAEIAELRRQERERKALAKAEGFDAAQISVTVRWFEKCAKHGEERMKAGEMTFRLYRATVQKQQNLRAVEGATSDPKLREMLAPKPVKETVRTRNLGAARAAADMAARAARGEL